MGALDPEKYTTHACDFLLWTLCFVLGIYIHQESSSLAINVKEKLGDGKVKSGKGSGVSSSSVTIQQAIEVFVLIFFAGFFFQLVKI